MESLSVRSGGVLEGADAAGDAVAVMAAVPGKIPGAVDPGLRRIAVSRPTRLQGRGLLRPGLARAIDADCYSLHGPAWANRLHRNGRADSRRRAGGCQSVSRGSVPA